MKSDFLLIVLRVCALLIFAILWAIWSSRNIRAIKRLRATVDRMSDVRRKCYPSAELPPHLRHNEAGEQSGGNAVSSDKIPDLEDERKYPYYNRTGQIVCNLSLFSAKQIMTGDWYGNNQWLQDIISGRVERLVDEQTLFGDREVNHGK